MKYLFVGGICDGRQIEVEQGQALVKTMRAPALRGMAHAEGEELGFGLALDEYEHQVYQRQIFALDNIERIIYVPVNDPPVAAFDRLLANYKPEEIK